MIRKNLFAFSEKVEQQQNTKDTRLIPMLMAFIETQIQIQKIELKEQLLLLLTKAFLWFLIVCVALIGFFMAAIGLAFALNKLLDSDFLGFLIISVIFLLATAVIIQQKHIIFEKILRQAESELISQENENNSQEEESEKTTS